MKTEESKTKLWLEEANDFSQYDGIVKAKAKLVWVQVEFLPWFDLKSPSLHQAQTTAQLWTSGSWLDKVWETDMYLYFIISDKNSGLKL